MPKVYIGVGSNIDRHIHIPQIIQELSEQFAGAEVSPIYESVADGFVGENFFNLVIAINTDLSAQIMREYLREQEARHGRVRDSKNQFIPRTLDLDQLLYGDQQINVGGVHVPSSDITNYAFVLKPLADIAGDMVHPILKRTFTQLWERFDKNNLNLKLVNLDTDDGDELTSQTNTSSSVS